MRSTSARALAGLVGGILALAACEIGLRLLWHNPYRNELPDQVLRLRVYHPFTDHFLDRSAIEPDDPKVRFRTDGRSYILPRRSADADARLLFLGGSTTECEAVREDLRFPALVGEILRDKGYRVDVLNAAHAGNTTQDSLNILLNRAVADRPDVAVMMHAVNDVGLLTEAGDYSDRMARSVELADAVRWAAQLSSSHLYLSALLRRWTTTARFSRIRTPREVPGPETLAPHTEQFVARLRAFVGIARAFGIVPVLMTQPLADFRTEFTPPWTNVRAQPMFNDLVRRTAAEEGVVLIDLVRFLEEDVPGWDRPMAILYDGMHVNDRGSEVYAGHIAERLAAAVLPGLAERHAPEGFVHAPGGTMREVSRPGARAETASPSGQGAAYPGNTSTASMLAAR